ncbi:hypothetical protein [Novosphingobium sediminis]|uniref:hypothetical protein n=1 Tax=Novosphingobium sediminis TaxID=707214 RepID=UPI0011BF799F|nr:hypothetical protein [Novosphingobium sediminis]
MIIDPSDKNLFRRKQSPTAAKRIFREQADLIHQGWVKRLRELERLGGDQSTLAEHPDDWMQRHTYRLVKWLIARGHQGILAALVDEVETRHGSRNDISDQPFKQALLAMFWGYERRPGEPLLDRRRRSELGDAMAYARLHGVQSKHFCGFAKQAGLKRIAAKLKAGHREPGFKVA